MLAKSAQWALKEWPQSGGVLALTTGNPPTHGKSALVPVSGGNLGSWLQDIQDTEHNGDYYGTTAGAREPCIYQEKFQSCTGENSPGTER